MMHLAEFSFVVEVLGSIRFVTSLLVLFYVKTRAFHVTVTTCCDVLPQIMDRFVTLRENINDPAVRRSLLIKIKHSIHCKKWRTKKSLLNKSKGDFGLCSHQWRFSGVFEAPRTVCRL